MAFLTSFECLLSPWLEYRQYSRYLEANRMAFLEGPEGFEPSPAKFTTWDATATPQPLVCLACFPSSLGIGNTVDTLRPIGGRYDDNGT